MAQDVKTCTAADRTARPVAISSRSLLSAASTAQQPPLPLVRNDLLWTISAQRLRLS